MPPSFVSALVGRLRGDDVLERELVAVLGRVRVESGAGALHLYSRDGSVTRGGRAGIVCFPETTAEVSKCVAIAAHHGRPFVPRGAGTGLAGGAVPCEEPVMVVTTRMDEIHEVDVERRLAWVGPGVVNLDLSLHLKGTGLHFAPDPSSQQACTIGGNVASNSGGPHCLLYGVTSAHVLAVEVVLPDGAVVVIGAEEGRAVGYDLRGAFVGGEGTLGIATKICVRLTEDPPEVATLLLDFESVQGAADTVSAVIADGIVPAALEIMDQRVIEAVEPFVEAGYPMDAAAVLIVELDGMSAGVAAAIARIETIGTANGARTVRVAATEDERARIWKGRKSAFGAIAVIKPDYYLNDTVIPRTRLAEVLTRVYEVIEERDLIVMNVFHAGDGNLHPLIVFDAREPGVMERVLEAGEEIVRISVEAGGVLSGEHGIGLEKKRFMSMQFSPADLEAQDRLRRAFDPNGLANPAKVLPSGASCGHVTSLGRAPEGTWV
ncbi:MAG: FAD-linked oxidase C-terminal domain-containing protein [Actinomycetota bacterium]|nr:FAD-linked oxidase C-terminal domain-containing protein [Actinomycetota bacterium]MED5220410.1 FAD-linked oxidase C-terminal domain-containing protein [Actinomycetota bacterium]MED5233220.1 FAD-linked oxidase C-terminal domain-containing protein [Actinomycetota bacterium]MEE3354236.1 FAD-linked oxidase C-terminal domain-containing protein [Actinomycetota bacterium]